MKMSLAQALRKRAELVAEVLVLQSRIIEAATYVEGSEIYSQKDYDELHKSLDRVKKSLRSVKLAIDKGNHVVMNGECVHSLIVGRGEAKAQLDFTTQLRNTLAGAGRSHYGYDENAPKQKTRANVKDLDAQLDQLRKELRGFDDRISDLNGRVEVEFFEAI